MTENYFSTPSPGDIAAAGPGHNSGESLAYRAVAGELRQIVEYVESLRERKAEIADLEKEFMADCKGRGYDTKAIKAIVALRKQDPTALAEFEAVMDMYRSAIGM